MVAAAAILIGAAATPSWATAIEPGAGSGQPKLKSEGRQKLPSPAKPAFGLLGSIELETYQNRFLNDLQSVSRRYHRQNLLNRDCTAGGRSVCSPRLKKWRRLIASLRPLTPEQQVARLNRSVNKLVKYADDWKVHGRLDYWADPLESFRRGGDCEDYATLKFFSLLELGFRHEDMRIAIVKDVRRNLLHAVLSVTLGERTVILDSLFHHPAEEKYLLKYKPVISFNLKRSWMHIVTRQIRVKYVRHHFSDPKTQTISSRPSPLLPQSKAQSTPVQESRLDACTVSCGRDMALFGWTKST